MVATLPDGADLIEMGVGGGGDDLEREAELEHLTPEEMDGLMKMSVVLSPYYLQSKY